MEGYQFQQQFMSNFFRTKVFCEAFHYLEQCFSTGVPRHMSVAWNFFGVPPSLEKTLESM